MNLQNSRLWFTSTMSVNMEGKYGAAAFGGLYECPLDVETGICGVPEKIVDVYNSPNEHHRGLDIMNVAIDYVNSTMYSGYFDSTRNSFEILKARLDSPPPVQLESFFRSEAEVSNAECLMECCENDLGHHTYYKLEPRDYIVHDGEVFVSWDGFYQNCADDFASQTGLKWTIGVSKVIQSSECVNTDGDHLIKFEECTTPAAILFQEKGSRARAQVLGYAGFEAAYAPSGKRTFLVSAIDNTSSSGVELYNEIWAMSEGENFAKNPNALHMFGRVRINNIFLNLPVDDVGSIRLRKSDNGDLIGMCRTAYDAGVICYSLHMNSDGTIVIENENRYVTAEQVVDSCTIPVLDHYPVTKHLPPVSTGLEVIWDPNAKSDSPKMLFFGCYGEINNHGNLTTVFRDGTLVQTLPGAYAGSILFGPDAAPVEATPLDIPPPNEPNESKSAFSPLAVVLLLLGTMVGFFAKRIIISRRQIIRRYNLIRQHDGDFIDFDPMVPSETAYVELSSKSVDAIA